ncbi:MAG: DUF3015 domain-containing protein [Nitrospiraceae bacterium]
MRHAVEFQLVAMLLAIQVGTAYATNPDTGPGCGLGKMLWADHKNQKNIAPQVLMVTTNGTGMNTFAISSGTSGCTNDGQVWAEQKVTTFASLNFDNLAQEMAQGEGEHLSSLATLMGVPAEHQAEFFAMTQEKYTSLMQGGASSPMALIKDLNDAIDGHPILAKATAPH